MLNIIGSALTIPSYFFYFSTGRNRDLQNIYTLVINYETIIPGGAWTNLLFALLLILILYRKEDKQAVIERSTCCDSI